MNNKLIYKLFIVGFFILYLGIALISYMHSIQFFMIGNALWMSVIVGACFELGNFLSLAAILLTDKNRKATMAWILLTIMVSIQCIANTYSTYKYIELSNTEYYQYLAKPLLFWIEEVSQDTIQIIVSWIIGAILPIVALFMTDMVATNYKNMHDNKTDSSPDDSDNNPSDKREPDDMSDEEYKKTVSELMASRKSEKPKEAPVERYDSSSNEPEEMSEGHREEPSVEVPTVEAAPVSATDVSTLEPEIVQSEVPEENVAENSESLSEEPNKTEIPDTGKPLAKDVSTNKECVPEYDFYGPHAYRADASKLYNAHGL